MRNLIVSMVVVSALAAPAGAETGVQLGGGLRWGETRDRVAFVVRGSAGVAPFLSLGVELFGLCRGGSDLSLDFGGASVGLMLSPPALGPVDLAVGLEAGVVPLEASVHGRDGLPAWAGLEVSASVGLGAGVSLRLAYDRVLTGGDARRALDSQLLLMIGVGL